jgi:hypothetical protein
MAAASADGRLTVELVKAKNGELLTATRELLVEASADGRLAKQLCTHIVPAQPPSLTAPLMTACPPDYWYSQYAKFPTKVQGQVEAAPCEPAQSSSLTAPLMAACPPDYWDSQYAKFPTKLTTEVQGQVEAAPYEPQSSSLTAPLMAACPPDYWDSQYAKFPTKFSTKANMVENLRVEAGQMLVQASEDGTLQKLLQEAQAEVAGVST